MPDYNYQRAQARIHKQILKFGGIEATKARLERDGVLRRCVAARLEYEVKERGLFAENSSRILISTIGLVLPEPDFELDAVIFAGDRYKILLPINGFRQGPSSVLFYDCNVVFHSKA